MLILTSDCQRGTTYNIMNMLILIMNMLILTSDYQRCNTYSIMNMLILIMNMLILTSDCQRGNTSSFIFLVATENCLTTFKHIYGNDLTVN